MEDLLQVGAITTTHGVRGEVKVFPMTDDVGRFKKLKKVLLENEGGYLELEITQVKFFKNLAILKFKGIDNINEVEKYKGRGLFVTREHAVKCEEGEYFIADLIGIKAETEEGELLGRLTDVLQTGANDVYVVQVDKDSPYVDKIPGKRKELLLPAIRDCILEVDMPGRSMRVRLLPGLLGESTEGTL